MCREAAYLAMTPLVVATEGLTEGLLTEGLKKRNIFSTILWTFRTP